MASITAKKNQAKLAEGIYKQTHCKYDINVTTKANNQRTLTKFVAR